MQKKNVCHVCQLCDIIIKLCDPTFPLENYHHHQNCRLALPDLILYVPSEVTTVLNVYLIISLIFKNHFTTRGLRP